MSSPLRNCAFCGSDENVTRDHVPPRNVFPPPRPNDLITVPACFKCNSATSKDDEYFRLKLCMSEQVGNNPDARNNREIILRSFERDTAAGWKSSFISDFRTVQDRTPAGLYLEKRLAYDVDLQRIFGIVEKTVRGLFFHETGRRLHPSYGVATQSDDTLRHEPAEFLEELRQTILFPLAQKLPKAIGRGAFSYRFHVTEEDPFCSVWVLTFYGQVGFLCLTGSTRDKESDGASPGSGATSLETTSALKVAWNEQIAGLTG